MRPLAAAEVLALWERGAHAHPIDRTLDLLACADPARDPEGIARLTLGSRDAALLEARRAMFGDRIEAQDCCPECGEAVEFELSCRTLGAERAEVPAQWALESGGYRLSLRALDSRDAAAAARCETLEAARATLLARSVLAAERNDQSIAGPDLPAEVVRDVAASLAEHDTCAELALDLDCPVCAHRWTATLDPSGFVWTELSARAEQLLGEVHALARAYGWSESEILALSPARRAAYLAMVLV